MNIKLHEISVRDLVSGYVDNGIGYSDPVTLRRALAGRA